MTVTKKRPQPGYGNHIRSKGSLIGTVSAEKQARWKASAKAKKKWSA